MLYITHDLWKASLKAQFNAAAAGMEAASLAMRLGMPFSFAPQANKHWADTLSASAEILERATREYPKPEFGLTTTQIGERTIKVTEEDVLDRPYCTLKRFKRDTDRNDPKVLLVAPMSGHYATLLRDTVKELLPHHDVYITDWKDARDVPLSEGSFGLEDYVTYLRDFMHTLGPQAHVVAVCQPTVPTLAAVSLMAEDNDPCQPVSMTLMAGPLDTRIAETEVNRYAKTHPIEWFERTVTDFVPPWYAGAGQRVYPGFVQLGGFVTMNPDRHWNAHKELYEHRSHGEHAQADKIAQFYDEYNAVCDLPAQFYLETVKQIFQDHALPLGKMTWKGRVIDPSKITKTSIFTVEGSKDDITAPLQTESVHLMCKNLPAGMKFHYLQEGAGHYGVFGGRRWREHISPRITGFIRASAARESLVHSAIPCDNMTNGAPLIHPCRWDAVKTDKSLFSLYNRDGGRDGKKDGNSPFSPR